MSPRSPSAAPARASFDPRRRLDSAHRLSLLSDRLDRLIMQVEIGAKSARQHDTHIEEAEAIADELRGIFRSPTQENPPRWQRGGQALW